MLSSRNLAVPALFLGGLSVASCMDLPTLTANICGNGFVEKNEDCDTALEGMACYAPGTPKQCRWICAQASDCPKDAQGQDQGWGCGVDGICRRPKLCASGPCPAFSSKGVIAENATRLLTADFDGSGRKSVLAVASPLVSVHYFGDTGLLVKTSSIVAQDASPSVGDLTSTDPAQARKASADFTLDTSRGLEVIRGSSEQALQPTVYASVSIPQKGQLLPVTVKLPDDPSKFDVTPPGFLVLPVDAEGRATAVTLPKTGAAEPKKLFSLAGSGGILAGSAVLDNFISTLILPCQQIAVPLEEAESVGVYSLCKTFGQGLNFEQDPDFVAPVSIKLPVGAKICKGCQGVHAVDLNKDGFPDLVISGSAPQGGPALFTAYNLKNGHFSSAPGGPSDDLASLYPVPFTRLGQQTTIDEERAHAPPLAVGDVNKDCALDYVNRFGIYLSHFKDLPFDCTRPTGYVTVSSFEDEHSWTSAIIADITGDGNPDVVVGSATSPGITFYRNTGLFLLNPSKLVTAGGVKNFTVGDFDGDFLTDLAFSEIADIDQSSAGRQALAIAFGGDNRGLGEPVVMGETSAIQQIVPSQVVGIGLDLITDLFVVSDNNVIGGVDIALFPGSGDRQLQAPYYLVDSLANAPDFPKQSTIGQFVGEAHNDIAVFGRQPPCDDLTSNLCDPALWLVPSTGEARIKPIGDPEGPVATRIKLSADGVSPSVIQDGVLMASVDLDPRDGSATGTDEVILLVGGDLPSQPPLLYVARVAGGKFDVGPPIKLEMLGTDRIKSMQLFVADVDGDKDKRPDLVLSSKSGVLVLWNHGTGSVDLSEAGATFLSAGDLPEASCGLEMTSSSPIRDVGALNADATPAKELIIVTGEAAYLARYDGKSLVASCQPDVPGGISVAGGDVNGDGVDDIVVGRKGGVELRLSEPAAAGEAVYAGDAQ